MKLKRKTIESETEEKILIGLIVSDTFCRDFHSLISKEMFAVDFIARAAMWCKSYYHKYKKAPAKHIQDIYETEKQKINSDDEREAISNLLIKLSEDHENSEFNEEYLADKARNYFRERSIRLSTDKASALLEIGKVEEAETILQKYKKTSTAFIGWENPFDETVIKNWFQDEISQKDVLFQLPGDIGKFIGAFQRNWLVSFLAPVKRGKCIAEGSKILLPNGEYKNIEDVVRDKDKNIISINAEGKIITSKISDHFDNGIKDVFRIKTQSGRIVETTANHPFLTIEGWKNLSEIKNGEQIAVPTHYNIFGNMNFPAHKAKLLAYLLADGGLTGSSIIFTKSDNLLIKDFINCVKKMGDDVVPVKNSKIEYRIIKPKNEKRLGGSKTRNFLKELGVERCKSNQKVVPDLVFKFNKKSLSLFLSALFSGDGSIYQSGENGLVIEYSSSNKEMIFQIQNLLLRFGISPIVVESKKLHNYASLHIKEQTQVKIFLKEIGFLFKKKETSKKLFKEYDRKENIGKQYTNCYSNYFCKKIIWPEIELYRAQIPVKKRERIKQIGLLRDNIKKGSGISKQVLSVIAKKINSEKLKSILNADILFDKIISIESIGRKHTYDLTVPETHCFIANDVVVHNTFFLLEIAVWGILSRKRTLIISLEMDKHRVYKRIYKRLTASADQAKEYIMPIFDCKLNQEGICEKTERKNKNRLLDDFGKKPKHFEKDLKYKVCTSCRGTKEFKPATWFTVTKREELRQNKAVKQISAISKQFGNKVRAIKYPTKTANVARIRSDIQALEENEGFVPDLIIIDYADILGKEDARESGRDAINATWEALKGMTDELHCCVVTASQSNRAGFDRENVTQTNASEDIRKMAHADIWFGINQTPDEKRASIARISKIAVRDGEFDQYESVIVTQQLATSQVILDSYLVRSQFDIEQDQLFSTI